MSGKGVDLSNFIQQKQRFEWPVCSVLVNLPTFLINPASNLRSKYAFVAGNRSSVCFLKFTTSKTSRCWHPTTPETRAFENLDWIAQQHSWKDKFHLDNSQIVCNLRTYISSEKKYLKPYVIQLKAAQLQVNNRFRGLTQIFLKAVVFDEVSVGLERDYFQMQRPLAFHFSDKRIFETTTSNIQAWFKI